MPARLAALLAALVSGRPGPALHAWRHDAPGHPSPNAGPVEAAFAGALGLRLGGTNHYAHGTEDRVVMGDGPAPAVDDVPRTVRLADRVALAAALTCAALPLLPRRPRRRATPVDGGSATE